MMNIYTKAYSIIKNNRQKPLLFLIVIIMSRAIFEALSIGIVLPFLILISNPDSINSNTAISYFFKMSGCDSAKSFIILTGVILIVIFIFKNICLHLMNLYIAKYTYNMQAELSSKFFFTYLSLPYSFHLNRNSSDLIHRSTGEVRNFIDGFFTPTITIVSELLIVSGLAFLILLTAPMLGLIATLAFLTVTCVYTLLNKVTLAGYGTTRSQSTVKMFKIINQGISTIKEVKVLDLSVFFHSKFNDIAKKFCKSTSIFQVYQQAPRLIFEAILVAGIISYLLVSTINDVDFLTIIPVLGLFTATAFRLLPSFHKIIQSLNNSQYNTVAVESLYADMQELEEYQQQLSVGKVLDQSLEFEKDPFKEIQLKSINFSYDENDAVIKDITLSIKKGEKIAFIGKSGSGKTTLINIILGLLTPQSGDILLNGESVITRFYILQKNMGYIPQDVYLVDDSLLANIAYGVNEADIDLKQVNDCIKMAQLTEFVDGLHEGVKTKIGERGVRISGGQRQRVAIARALYRNPEILIMDEATSALDYETEAAFNDAINALSGNHTLLIVAHRFSTVKNADRVILLEEGEIAQIGKFEELKKENEWLKNADK